MLVPPSKKRSILFATNCAPCKSFADSCISAVHDQIFFGGAASKNITPVLYVSSFFLRSGWGLVQAVMLQATKRGWEIAFNLGSTTLDEVTLSAIGLSTIVIGNASEWLALGLLLEISPTENLLQISKALPSLPPARGGRIVVITRGEDSTLVLDRAAHSREYSVPTGAIVVDTTGAGDAFAGGFLLGIVLKKSIHECVRAGHFAAKEIISTAKPCRTYRSQCAFAWMNDVVSALGDRFNCSYDPLPAISKTSAQAFLALRENAINEYEFVHRELLDISRSLPGQLSILDIGTGDGQVINRLLEELGVSPCAVDAFEPEHFFKMPSVDFPNYVFHQELFTAKTELSRKFSLIIFCHSLYGQQDAKGVLLHAIKFLEEHGRLIIFHRRDKAEFFAEMLSDTLTAPYAVKLVTHDSFLQVGSEKPGQGVELSTSACSCLFGKDFGPAWSNDDQLQLLNELGSASVVLDGKNVLDSQTAMIQVYFQTAQAALEVLAKEIEAEGGFFFWEDEAKTFKGVKISAEARTCKPRALCQPRTEMTLVGLLKWAKSYRQGVTVCSGGHSDHCLVDGAVAIHLGAWNEIRLNVSEARITAGGGVSVGEICKVASAASLTVPLGARPSVGMGLALLGGIGHLSRSLGLSIDNIISLRMALASGDIVDLSEETNRDIFTSALGAAPCFGVVLEITFRCSPLKPLAVWERHVSLPPVTLAGWSSAAENLLSSYCADASGLPDNESADAFICWVSPEEMGFKLQCFSTPQASSTIQAMPRLHDCSVSMSSSIEILENPYGSTASLYDRELYLHFKPEVITGTKIPSKILSFKRCVLLRSGWDKPTSAMLLSLVSTAPTKLCYIHFVHCGGVVSRIPQDKSEFSFSFFLEDP